MTYREFQKRFKTPFTLKGLEEAAAEAAMFEDVDGDIDRFIARLGDCPEAKARKVYANCRSRAEHLKRELGLEAYAELMRSHA